MFDVQTGGAAPSLRLPPTGGVTAKGESAGSRAGLGAADGMPAPREWERCNEAGDGAAACASPDPAETGGIEPGAGGAPVGCAEGVAPAVAGASDSATR